jgi:hypothetical protein
MNIAPMASEYVARPPPSSRYIDLFRSAAHALEAEDRALREAMGAGEAKTGGYGDVAHGLRYWLYEATLVYVIFRAWVSIEIVAWEYAVGDKANRPSAFTDGRRGASEKCDLMLLGKDNTPEAAFEAKWWNTSASGKSLLADVRKLRRTCGSFKSICWSSGGALKAKLAPTLRRPSASVRMSACTLCTHRPF